MDKSCCNNIIPNKTENRYCEYFIVLVLFILLALIISTVYSY